MTFLVIGAIWWNMKRLIFEKTLKMTARVAFYTDCFVNMLMLKNNRCRHKSSYVNTRKDKHVPASDIIKHGSWPWNQAFLAFLQFLIIGRSNSYIAHELSKWRSILTWIQSKTTKQTLNSIINLKAQHKILKSTITTIN